MKFLRFYSKNNFISYVNNFTDELDEQFEKKLFNEKLFKKYEENSIIICLILKKNI